MYDSMNVGKSSQLGKHGFGSLHKVIVIEMRASYFDTDFLSEMKLTTLPLIQCFVQTEYSPLVHGL